MQNAFLNKKWLHFCKTQFLSQNDVKPRKRCFQHKILKNPAYNKKDVSQPTVDAKRIFKQEIVKFKENTALNNKWCKNPVKHWFEPKILKNSV